MMTYSEPLEPSDLGYHGIWDPNMVPAVVRTEIGNGPIIDKSIVCMLKT